MRSVFAGRIGAVMASRAVTGDGRVIKIRRRPGDRRVAVVAIVAACEVRRMLAGRRSTVVARSAAAKYLGVVDPVGWYPGDRVVAVFAHIGGLNVGSILARRFGAVMAAHTVAGDVDVIEIRWDPARRVMAV